MNVLSALGMQFSVITADSRQVKAGALFLAYPGTHSDGRHYIAQAIKAGASAVAWEKEGFTWRAEWNVPNVAVHELKRQVGHIAADFYHQPSKSMTVIGVTGTNGKTSVSQWVAQCLESLGQKSAVLGTIGNGIIRDGLAAAVNTTPDAVMLQAMLAEFLHQNVKAVAMEVSSHGLDQNRVSNVEFDVAVLTNLSRDHLDYHETMEAYAAAKQKLFACEDLKAVVTNADDAFGQEVAGVAKAQGKLVLTYGLTQGNVRGSSLQLHQQGLLMNVTTPQGDGLLIAPVLGRFNAYNVLAVLTALLALNVDFQDALAAIAKLKPVQGRMQQLGGDVFPLVVIDYAHTPDALEKVLLTLREQLQEGKKLICVFGCGGNRDAGKRPLMGAVASKIADAVVVTSDNPRSENPAAIISEIESGMHAGYQVEIDRAIAINLAISMAQAGDVVLVAGKGHEDYQEISGVKMPFSDLAVAQSALSAWSASS